MSQAAAPAEIAEPLEEKQQDERDTELSGHELSVLLLPSPQVQR
jgi:hypothetical protein